MAAVVTPSSFVPLAALNRPAEAFMVLATLSTLVALVAVVNMVSFNTFNNATFPRNSFRH